MELAYPAALTVVGVVGNACILGNQIKQVKDDIKDIKHDITHLTARETAMGLQETSFVERLVKDRGKNK